ncbi:GAF domain-containing protein [Adonisia turfae]|uniref:GAF domain-containing protein n=1 Tax=Adonisia turfae TaxID=2950184 RepID=UPI0020299F57|nr:GAF domain-containing protein [Adonisia turfae]
MTTQFDPNIHAQRVDTEVGAIGSILQRLGQTIQRDQLVQKTTEDLRTFLQVNRVVIYYFYNQWEGQVTFEALSAGEFSIYGSTGPDQCFNDEYAELYLAGRIRAIEDIETAPIEPCHRDFLRHLHVRANLVVPILTNQGLWGLLVAHHCQGPKTWSEMDVKRMQAGALTLASAPSIQDH